MYYTYCIYVYVYVYAQSKTKRPLTIRHAATMIPRVTIPAFGSGQIQRKANIVREGKRNSERREEREKEE